MAPLLSTSAVSVPLIVQYLCYTQSIQSVNCKSEGNIFMLKGGFAMDYSIVWVRGHVEVYDWAGRFCFSADSEREALEELDTVA